MVSNIIGTVYIVYQDFKHKQNIYEQVLLSFECKEQNFFVTFPTIRA